MITIVSVNECSKLGVPEHMCFAPITNGLLKLTIDKTLKKSQHEKSLKMAADILIITR